MKDQSTTKAEQIAALTEQLTRVAPLGIMASTDRKWMAVPDQVVLDVVKVESVVNEHLHYLTATQWAERIVGCECQGERDVFRDGKWKTCDCSELLSLAEGLGVKLP